MRRIIGKSIIRGQLWVQRKHEVGRFDSIILSDVRKTNDQFRECLLAALALLKTSDNRRFNRVQHGIGYILNCTLGEGGAQYHHDTRTCIIDFTDAAYEADPDLLVVYQACTLVHESTHAVIQTRGIPYSPENRTRIERLCVTEENRFLLHLRQLRPDILQRLNRTFDENDWSSAWNSTPLKDFAKALRRIISK